MQVYWICLIVSYKFSKSKLINTNRNHLRSNYEIRCPAQYSRIPYYPLKSVWKQWLSIYPNRPFKCPHETLTQTYSSFHAYSAEKKKKRFRRESQAKQEEYKECDGKRKSVLVDSRRVPGELEGASPLNQKALEKYEAVVWKAASTWSLSLSLSGWRTSHGDTRLCAQSGSRPVSMLTY